jgi:catechol 2,3-dioxygenase-like lactoylglutathione lyase family enzyme
VTAAELEPDLVVIVVPTTRLAESVRFYGDVLGLRLLEEWSEMGRGALFQASNGAQIELVEMEDVPAAKEPRTTIGLKIVGVDEVHARLAASGAEIKAPPRTREWGMYGFGTYDPNGVPLNIYEPVPAH